MLLTVALHMCLLCPLHVCMDLEQKLLLALSSMLQHGGACIDVLLKHNAHMIPSKQY